MQKKKENNIKEILKPLVRKILLENENLPNSPETPGHREEAPKSRTVSMGTGAEKVNKVAREAFSTLKDLDLNIDDIDGEIRTKIIEDILFKDLGPRAYQAAQVLLNSRVFISHLDKIKNETGSDISYLFDPEFIKDQFDNID